MGSAGLGRSLMGRVLQTAELDEDGPAFDRLSGGVELVAVQPRPAVVRLPVVDSDHTEQHRLRELDACLSGYPQNITGPG
jgi:hypothetical protein